jgi:tRNA nucleotidyltransferase/poly(A) polymerase
MRATNFNQYRLMREAADGGNSGTPKKANGADQGLGAIGTKVSLGDGNDFLPFEVSDDPKSEHYGKNKNLAPLVRSFKNGGNWGWSRDDSTGTDKPVKISGKRLYLAGGSVRDHLKGKKARNIELATNASPDEVYHLLKQNGFEFISDKGTVGNAKTASKSPNRKEGSKQFFWVEKTSKNKRPFTFGINVNGDEFSLEVFMKTPRGNVQADDLEPGTHAEDAAGRDFTINGMYILLSNDNGPNKELSDFFGGMHHLASGRISAIGDMGSKLKEDPSRIMRYVRMMSGYGDAKKIPEEEKKTLAMSSDGLGKMDRKAIMDEFKKGLDRDGTDPREYMKLFRDLGLLDHLFPGKHVDADLPKELSELGDKHMPMAWMLRMNDPGSLEDLGLDPKDIQKIRFLIKSLGMSENMDSDSLNDMIGGYTASGISSKKLREFGTKLGGLDPNIMDAFINYAKDSRVRPYKPGEGGTEVLDDSFQDLMDPFTNQPNHRALEERKKHFELQNFKKHVSYMRPE